MQRAKSRNIKGMFKGGVPLGVTIEHSETKLESEESKLWCLAKCLELWKAFESFLVQSAQKPQRVKSTAFAFSHTYVQRGVKRR